jgi:hypothetical protein
MSPILTHPLSPQVAAIHRRLVASANCSRLNAHVWTHSVLQGESPPFGNKRLPREDLPDVPAQNLAQVEYVRPEGHLHVANGTWPMRVRRLVAIETNRVRVSGGFA